MAAQYTRRGPLCPFSSRWQYTKGKTKATVNFESERFFSDCIPLYQANKQNEKSPNDETRAE